MPPSERYAHGDRAPLDGRGRGGRAVRLGLVDAGDSEAAGRAARRRVQPAQVGRPHDPGADVPCALGWRLAASGRRRCRRCPRGRRGSRTRHARRAVRGAVRHAACRLPGLRLQRLSGQVLRHDAAGVGLEGRRDQGLHERRAFTTSWVLAAARSRCTSPARSSTGSSIATASCARMGCARSRERWERYFGAAASSRPPSRRTPLARDVGRGLAAIVLERRIGAGRQ